MKYEISAKPTKYNGRLYRSRLEARWAAFFDLLEWDYEYEPVDFKHWSPDFLINGYDGIKLYLEIKPYIDNDIICNYYSKMIKSSLFPQDFDQDQFFKEKDIFVLCSSVNLDYESSYIQDTIRFGIRIYSCMFLDHLVFKYPFDISSDANNWNGLITKEGQEHSNRKYHIQTTYKSYDELMSLWNMAANKVMFLNPIKNG